MNRQTFNNIIFGLSVIMILLRPFIAYQISIQSSFTKDPQKVISLLQRLIKKKDEHHEYAEVEISESRNRQVIFARPLNILNRFIDFLQLLSSTLLKIKSSAMINLGHFAPPERYLLISRFQI
jgi:hypothetical protein